MSHVSVVCFLSVPFAKHIVQKYTFVPYGELRQQVDVSLDCL
jgi:hypothetical protein